MNSAEHPNIEFCIIRQGRATNTLTKIKPKEGYNMVLDPITRNATINQKGLTLFVAQYEGLTGGIRTSTYRLFDSLMIAFTQTSGQSTLVNLPLVDYMKLCNIRDEKSARCQVIQDLEVLFRLKLSFKGSSKRKQDFMDVRLCDAKGIKNSIIFLNFSVPFYNILMGYPVMPYPLDIFKLNLRRNPNSHYFLRRITEHKNMNSGKNNEDIIAVKTLIASSPELPSYEEAKHWIQQRIITPFERDMDALAQTLSWEYCHTYGTPLLESELIEFNYLTFSNLLIKVFWRNYPKNIIQNKKAKRSRILKPKIKLA